ncbi:MAG: MBOAT family protein [Desulfobulbaceae bacterium]|nr:MBOAT family protein [Desulfobulbaceae bacterium]
MVFSSITFLFFFLPVALLAYYCSGRARNITLLAMSLLFYSWGEGIYVLVMLGSIWVNYFAGIYLQKKHKKTVLTGALLYNFSLLGIFKYANFITDNVNTLLSHVHISAIQLDPVHLPIGISFFTFQAVSYIIDVYRGTVPPQKSILNLGLYISLFPQLIAGPIVRYHDIAKSLHWRKFRSVDFSYGIERFLLGLSKKVLLANPLGLVADKIFALSSFDLNSPAAWLGALCYTLQIYYDFSGYSDMAIGLGRMFGFRFLENFNYPYISNSMQDFWRRWHISLSSWFRDYLYIPLGGNRKGTSRTCVNLLIVFFLCGLWHGANWSFVCWGLFHGFFLVLERTKIKTILNSLWLPIRHVITLTIIVVGWVIFRSETISEAISFLAIMFGATQGSERQLLSIYLDQKLFCEFGFALLFATPIFPLIQNYCLTITQRFSNDTINSLSRPVIAMARLSVLTAISYFTIISLSASAYNPFIYFRF